MRLWILWSTVFITLLSQKFIQASENQHVIVYLTSFPRSGNHWARYLIEEATHVATSSVYCDPNPPHLPDPFPWGGYCCEGGYEGQCRFPNSDDPVFLKTHYPVYEAWAADRRPYKAVCIVRHPIDSIYSHYLYLHGGNPPSPKIPSEKLREYILSWRKFQHYWERQPSVLMVRYEDFYRKPFRCLKSILEVAGCKVKKEDIARAVAAYPPEGALLKHLSHYSKGDLRLIQQLLGDYMLKFNYHTPGVSRLVE